MAYLFYAKMTKFITHSLHFSQIFKSFILLAALYFTLLLHPKDLKATEAYEQLQYPLPCSPPHTSSLSIYPLSSNNQLQPMT